MDRCALFVDASYALADGARAVHGTRNRDSVSWDYAGLLKLLGGMSRDRTGLPLLRCYWYDISPDGNRTDEHDSLADIPGVKLRLTKVRPNRKEGVEAEIRKDLTALARNHAVSDVIIVSAEEDLAPVIAEVQDLGIRAILLTIASEGDWATSRALQQECDDLIEIAPGHLRPYVDLISGAEPQLAASSYRGLADGSQSAEQHRAIEAPAQRLYSSPLGAVYEGVPQPQLAGLSGHREQREPVHGHSQEPSAQQSARAQQYQHAESGRELLAPNGDQGFRATGYPAPESGRNQASQSSGGFGQHGVSDEGHGRGGSIPGSLPIGPPGAAQLGAPGQNGVAGAGMAPSRDNMPAGQPGNGLPAAMPPGTLAASGPGPAASQNGLSGNGLGPVAQGGHPPAGGYAGNGHSGAGSQRGGQQGMQPHGLSANGLSGNGLSGNGLPGNGLSGNGIQGHQYGQGSGPQQGSQDGGRLQGGLGGGSPSQAGMQQPGSFGSGSVNQAGPGQSQHGGPRPGSQGQAGLAHDGLPHEAIGQFGGLQSQGQSMQGQSMPGQSMQAHSMPGHSMPGESMAAQPMQAQSARQPGPGPANAAAQQGLPPQPPGQHSQQLAGQQLAGQQLTGQQLSGQAVPGSGHTGPDRHGSNLGGPLSASQPNGLAPLESQRPPLPERQLPVGNGVHYAPDGSSPYGGGQVQPSQFGAPPSTAYGRGAYGGQPGAPSPGLSVGDAVQAAHAEGFGFGEAVARDAPALWLEAVLARKPRMPSDLEARLLQGSALPIDSLLHDEVRHALRRGFWDALERSRH